MSLHTRTTEDYSPLRAPIRDAHGRDMRPKAERQQYEQAVNARREMLNVIGSAPPQKLSKKAYERLTRIRTPLSGDREVPLAEQHKRAFNADGRSRRVLKDMLRGVTVAAADEE
jgi:hypothetical protein